LTTSTATYPCTGAVSWTASVPPPAVTPGRYCGFTNQGPSICLDVAESGREVTRVEVGVVVRCHRQSSRAEAHVHTAPSEELSASSNATSFEGRGRSGGVSGTVRTVRERRIVSLTRHRSITGIAIRVAMPRRAGRRSSRVDRTASGTQRGQAYRAVLAAHYSTAITDAHARLTVRECRTTFVALYRCSWPRTATGCS
jgi:hypothetical protein